jgi:hypothetical protein
VTGFAVADTVVLETIRRNLLTGLEQVHQSLTDGTFDVPGLRGAASPSQSGQITLALLTAVDAELARRNLAGDG